jgi:endo-1,4-beta-xylanase
MLNIDRRAFLAMSAALCASPAWSAQSGGDGLRVRAARNHRLYGTSVDSRNLKADPRFSQAVATEAGILVAESETKRKAMEPAKGQYYFGGTDAILNFAHSNTQLMRGHTMVWHEANPAWLEAELPVSKDERLLTDYIAKVGGRYKGQFQSWDVVNEAIEPNDGHPLGLRMNSIWYEAFGDSYIETAFHAAKEADPKTPLFYNETNLEGDDAWFEPRRTATLKLIERLLARNVPLQGFGMQSHLKAFRSKYSEAVISKFLDEIAAFGLPILITEFDVADIRGPADPAQRDAAVADLTRMFLDVAFSKKAVLGCITWGLTDKYSWLSLTPAYKWSDGQLSRGLPLDGDFNRKPMWTAMASCFDKSQA